MHNITPKNFSKKNNNYKQKELAVMIEISVLEDPRFFLLLEKFGIEGVGIYFTLILQMRRLDDFGLSKIDIAGIAIKFRVDKNKILQLLDYASSPDVGLFRFEQDRYFSLYLCEKMEDYQGICEKNKENGSKGGRAKAERESSERLATASNRLATASECLASAKRPVSDPNLIQSNLIQSNLTESKNLDQDLDTNTPLAPESIEPPYELSEKAKKFASKLKIDLEPKKSEDVPKPTITEDVTQGENEQNQGKQPDEIKKTTESIDPPKENALMAKFGSFDLPEDLEKYMGQVDSQLCVADGTQLWEMSSQFMLAGRRPLKAYPEIFLTPFEMAQILKEYEKRKIKSEIKTAGRMVYSKILDMKAKGENTEFKSYATWFLGWVMTDLLDKKIKTNILEKQEQRK